MLLANVDVIHWGDVIATAVILGIFIGIICFIVYVVSQSKKQKVTMRQNEVEFEQQMKKLQKDIDSLQEQINNLPK